MGKDVSSRYNASIMRNALRWLALWIVGGTNVLVAVGCASSLAPLPETVSRETSLIFGHVHIVQRGAVKRIYPPIVRFFELYSPTHDRRFRIDVNAERRLFALAVPPGHYVLTRIQIAEGAFRGMARVDQRFHVESTGLTYVGDWTITLAPPRYDRTLHVTVAFDRERAAAAILDRYPDLANVPIRSSVMAGEKAKARVWEIYPYPRMKYFFRHHPT